MFGLFKKKSRLDKLQDEYKKLLLEAHKLSKTNRQESDKRQVEARTLLDQIEVLQKSA
ncbi:Lacal_2735 family protein [Pontimicrobium sp. MEBiC01747]|jgi:hypothetical protein